MILGLAACVSVIDHLLVQDGRILAKFKFCRFKDQDKVEVNKHGKND